jgi:arthrofactin-type cyclic lipopeptide synthetase C
VGTSRGGGPDGTIEFLGRPDLQVKSHGFRIELEEIAARLTDHPTVREAVVLMREDEPGNNRPVVCYTTAVRSEGSAAHKLRSYLTSVLPEYMVPSAYVQLENLPLTPNGKLDRKALPAPGAAVDLAYKAPQGETEIMLADIWAELLKPDRIGRHDNFFELDGNSLLAAASVVRHAD